MEKVTKWVGPLSGLLFVVLLFVGISISGGHGAEPSDSASVALQDFADNADEIRVGSILLMVGVAFFLFFAAYLRDQFRSKDAGWWPSAFLAGGVVLTSALVTIALLDLGGAVAAENGDAEVVKAVIDFQWEMAITWAAPLLVMGAASAVVILGRGVLPQWLGWFAILVALGALVPWIGFLVFLAWVLAVSIVQLLAARRPEPSAG